MSATLGAILKSLAPQLRIQVYEATGELAQESSSGWNNAGTGHAGICELSYTPERSADGSVNVWRAVTMFERFERSKQFWGYAVANGMAGNPREFINRIPHISFVHGSAQVDFLRARHAAMVRHHFFKEMVFTTDPEMIGRWAPLLVEGRRDFPIAATKMDDGTDVNFGEIARRLLTWLSRQDGCSVVTNLRVVDLERIRSGWNVWTKDLVSGERSISRTAFVFVGAGGGSLHLLQKSKIPEGKGLGGFPIGGQWLVCERPEVVCRHQAKVYGHALDAAPTMAVPHLDTRVLDGKEALLFGPFAAWTTKFLQKKGSWTDLPLSIKADNYSTLVKIGMSNMPLIRYLIQQGTQKMADRIDVLRTFYPGARAEDWKLVNAGIRVQAIKKTDGEAGIVHYGTEVITNADKTIAALLGASPGASVAVNVALDIIERCLPHLLSTSEGNARRKAMIPAHNEHLIMPEKADLFRDLQRETNRILQLA